MVRKKKVAPPDPKAVHYADVILEKLNDHLEIEALTHFARDDLIRIVTQIREEALTEAAFVYREALAAFDVQAQAVGACGDGYCLVTGRANGMHTNGGCRCWMDKMKAQRMMGAGRRLREAMK